MRFAETTVRASKTYALVFDGGDDVIAEIARFAKGQGVKAASLAGIGGLSGTTLGYYSRERKQYEPRAVEEQVELLSLIGNVTVCDGEPLLHAHAVVARRDGSVTGGHLLAARVWPTLELFVDVYDYELKKISRSELGIATVSLP